VTRASVAFGVALLIVVGALFATLTQRSPEVIEKHRPGIYQIASTTERAEACQRTTALPAGISAIRLSLASFYGPSVATSVRSGGHLITSGTLHNGWYGRVATIPVDPAPQHRYANVDVCLKLGGGDSLVYMYGQKTKSALAATSGGGARLKGVFTIEYLRPGKSWLSQVLPIARRLGLGKAWDGTWNAVLISLLMLSAVSLAFYLVARELR
jgi:hypothetical protein